MRSHQFKIYIFIKRKLDLIFPSNVDNVKIFLQKYKGKKRHIEADFIFFLKITCSIKYPHHEFT